MDGASEGGGGYRRVVTQEKNGDYRGELRPLVRCVKTYGRTYRGGQQSDGRGAGIGYLFQDTQYMEQE